MPREWKRCARLNLPCWNTGTIAANLCCLTELCLFVCWELGVKTYHSCAFIWLILIKFHIYCFFAEIEKLNEDCSLNKWLLPLLELVATQGAYKFGKIKFPEFSRFSRPLKQFLPYNYNVKTRCNEPPYQPFRYLSCSNAELQNIFLRSIHPRQSLCHPNNLCSACCGFQIVSQKHTIWFSKISRVYFKFPSFPEFSKMKKTLSFSEL